MENVYTMKLETIEDAEKFFKKCGCSWFFIYRETLRDEELKKLNIPDETYTKWTCEYVNEALDNLDYSRKYDSIICQLNRYIGYSISMEIVNRIYDIFINLYNKEKDNKESARIFTIDFILYRFNLCLLKIEKTFSGLLALLYNDPAKVKTLSNILLDELEKKNEEDQVFPNYKAFAAYNVYYGLNYDSRIRQMFVNKGKEELEFSMEYGSKDWPLICYLGGYVVEKDYINAYRALRMDYEKSNNVSDDFIKTIEFINEITKMNYTVDDVLALTPFKEEYEKSDFDKFLDQALPILSKKYADGNYDPRKRSKEDMLKEMEELKKIKLD